MAKWATTVVIDGKSYLGGTDIDESDSAQVKYAAAHPNDVSDSKPAPSRPSANRTEEVR